MASPRQLAAIMFTDIVGYTAIMQRNEKQAVAMTKRYLAALKDAVAIHSGRILNDYGDGSLCIFSSAMAAVKCAVAIQQQLQTPPPLPLRIGLHIGEIFFEEEKVFGDGVNVASRIQSLGIGGSVLFSKEVYDTIRNHDGFEARSLGDFEFKNVEEPMEVYALVGEGFAVPRREQMEGKLKESLPGSSTRMGNKKKGLVAGIVVLVVLAALLMVKGVKGPIGAAVHSSGEKNSVAVLYFSNMSGDPRQEYFSDGITEEIIARLSMIEGLRVKSRTSVLQYKGKSKSAKQIARELGVKNILEGSVRKHGNQLRVTAQLIDAAKDEHIWAENYDRELRDVFAVQSDIAQHIAGRFQIKLSDATKRRLETPLTLNTDAYDYFLKARSLSFLNFSLGGEKTNRQTAIGLLHQALQLDPAFSEAYALLSVNYSIMSWDVPNPQHWIDSALLLAKAAIQHKPDKTEGYEALANVYETMGDIDEALKWAKKADQVRPYSMVLYIAQLYSRKNEYGKAMEWTAKAIRRDPADPQGYFTKASLFYELGMLDSMKQYLDVAVRVRPDRSDAVWANAAYYRITHNAVQFERIMRELSSQDERSFNYDMAVFYLFDRNWKKADSLYPISSHPEDMDAGLVKLRIGEEATGRRYFAKALKTRLQAVGNWDHWRYYDVARIYAALQDPRYIQYLEKALDHGWHEYSLFEQDPFFDAVRPTPEFQHLARLLYRRNEQFRADLLRSL